MSDAERYRRALHDFNRRRIISLPLMFGGYVFLVVGFILITHFHWYTPGPGFHWQSWVVMAGFAAIEIAGMVCIKRFRCPRCGDYFYWPDQLLPIKACVHCGLPLLELIRLGKTVRDGDGVA